METHPDVVADLNHMPWPFQDESFDQVRCFDVIEHLEDIVQVMDEVNRVCSRGAVIQITVPHFSSANAFTDPTHRHYFGYFSFSYFTGEHEFSYYTVSAFRKRHAAIIFHPTVLGRLVSRLANRRPDIYEKRWAWIFPAWHLYFELEAKPTCDASASGTTSSK